MNIGNYSRNGKSRNGRKALDHDFKGKTKDLMLYFTRTKATADFIIDIIEDFWLSNKNCFLNIKTLIVNLDNETKNSNHNSILTCYLFQIP